MIVTSLPKLSQSGDIATYGVIIFQPKGSTWDFYVSAVRCEPEVKDVIEAKLDLSSVESAMKSFNSLADSLFASRLPFRHQEYLAVDVCEMTDRYIHRKAGKYFNLQSPEMWAVAVEKYATESMSPLFDGEEYNIWHSNMWEEVNLG